MTPVMTKAIETDLCVIGGGSGGLSVAAGASQMGARVVLLEKGDMGGDCLNSGCVPSKSLLAAAHAANAVRHASRFGIDTERPIIQSERVFGHVRDVIAAIEPNDSQERFEGLGVTVLRDHARFSGPTQVTVGNTVVNAKRVVVATGSSPFVPPIKGLEDVGYRTNETVFDQRPLPEHLIIVGGGPIGLEMAQAYRHLGSRVTVLEAMQIMPKDDPELVEVLRRRFTQEGIAIHEAAKVAEVRKAPAGGIDVMYERDGARHEITGDELLIAAGRKANVDGLDLDRAGIAYSPKGIQVDDRLRTTNKKVFAIGDVAGGLQFTHVAGYHAGVVIKNALFRLPSKADHSTVPWVTYTDPEIAQVGLTEAQARDRGLDFEILRWPFHENDRAQAEGATDGLVKAVVTPKGKILGCGIAGKSAGELIGLWVLAMGQSIKIGGIAQMIQPYPTLAEVSKRAAGSFYTPRLFTERTKAIVRFLLKFG